jgi:riboflavin synthase
MFTGIVEELGEIVALTGLADEAARIEITGPLVTSDVSLGDSIAVNGVCLTVAGINGSSFVADVMRETMQRSSLGALATGSRVNLERPVTLSSRLGGHLVQGHVDAVGRVLSRESTQHWDVVRISVPDDISRYIVEKGSITVDGVSLTVVQVVDAGAESADSWFSVSLIPTTLSATTLGRVDVGDLVNLEVDIVAKYVERMMGQRS